MPCDIEYKKLATTFANILLNNYSKVKMMYLKELKVPIQIQSVPRHEKLINFEATNISFSFHFFSH